MLDELRRKVDGTAAMGTGVGLTGEGRMVAAVAIDGAES